MSNATPSAPPDRAQLVAAPDPIIFVIDRSSVEKADIAPPLQALRAMASTAEATREHAGRVQFVFSGYEGDRRELYAIAEVRSFINSLNDEFPYWFHFVSKVDDSLFVILMSLLPQMPVTSDNGRVQTTIDSRAWNKLTLDLFGFMNDLYARHGLTAADNSRTTGQVLQYVRTFVS